MAFRYQCAETTRIARGLGIDSPNLRQAVDTLAVDLYGYEAMQLPTARPLYGNAAPEPIGSREAQLALPSWLNDRAWTIFGGTNEVQSTIIARSVLGL